MQRFTWEEASEYLRNYNREHGYTTKGTETHCYMVAVITEDSFDKEFTLTVNVYSKSNLTIKAHELKYVSATNEETDEPYTTCTDAQCAIDELYEIYGN